MRGGGGFRGPKRKRNWGPDCLSFPGESPRQSRRASLSPVRTAALSEAWLRCGEGFLDTSGTQSPATQEKSVAGEHLESSPGSDTEAAPSTSVRALAEITWSSSGSDLSGEDGALHISQGDDDQDSPRIHRLPDSDSSASEAEPREDERQPIDWEVDSDREEDGERRTAGEGESAADISDSASCESSGSPAGAEGLPAAPEAGSAEILEYSSDSEREDNLEDVSLVDSESSPKYCVDFQADRRQTTERVKSVETTLCTPQKQAKFPRTPEKARKKLLSGGLAERLSGLQNRERSAISWWRHQCASYQQTLPGGKSGVLMVRVLELQEECSLQVALCEQLAGPQAHCPAQGEAPGTGLKVLFTKETAGHLRARPRDVVHIHPPWQKLTIPNESCPVILNTYFCKKVTAKGHPKPVNEMPSRDPPLPRRSITLAQIFRLRNPVGSSPGDQALCADLASAGKDRPPEHGEAERLSARDSLLDAVESRGVSSGPGGGVRVVVQRSYCLPSSCQQGGGLSALPTSDPPGARVCLLVQDAYGLFSEVHIDTTIWKARQLEGKSCSLVGVKVLQKATRERTVGLFSLIDSLWPPAAALQAPDPHPACREETARLSPPSFCYILTVDPDLGRVDVSEDPEDPVSKLYQPPVPRPLRTILQTTGRGTRCSFYATVIYQRPQLSSLLPPEPREFWLTVTDETLQTPGEGVTGLTRTLPVYVTPACIPDPQVQEALAEAAPHSLLFRDALRDHGRIVCADRTVLLLQKPLLGTDSGAATRELTGPPKLDELCPSTQVNSICSVQGTVVGVDESTAFSWPTCNLCGNGRLEQDPEDGGVLSCRACFRVVTCPLLRRHLQVFLSCSSHPRSTVKVKLLQNSISSLLRSAACEDGTYEVQSVLGKEVGPLPCYVLSTATHSARHIALEEIELLKAGRVCVESHRSPRDP